MEKLFTYGTLQDSPIQQQVLGRLLDNGTPDTVRGYKMSKLVGIHTTYNIIQPESGKLVDGVVYEVTEEELEKLDAYEGDAYIRVSTTLLSNTRAWIYRDNPRSDLQSHIKPVD